MSTASLQWCSYHSWSWATSELLSILMFSSTFCVRPGRVKLLDPTSACDPMTSKRPWVMYAFAWNLSLL